MLSPVDIKEAWCQEEFVLYISLLLYTFMKIAAANITCTMLSCDSTAKEDQ